MKWSHYQQAIFEAFEHTPDSLLIEAVAGSGKTTVLVELARIMQRAFPQQRGCFMAFNKSIATTLQERISPQVCNDCGGELNVMGRCHCPIPKHGTRALPSNVVAMTLHSAGWAAWRRAGGLDWTPTLDQHKTSNIIRQMMSWEERKKWEETTRKLVGFAKGVGLVPKHCNGWYVPGTQPYAGLVPDSQDTWDALIEHYGLDEEECNIDWARKVLARSIEMARESCDYDDMLYMPVVAGVPFERYDVVLVDEAQDVSGIQMEMISRMVRACTHENGLIEDKPAGHSHSDDLAEYIHCGCLQGRVIAVGDRSQAIYGFRGAGTDSMDLMRERFGMRELPLSVSYRCPRSVVEHARQWVPQIEWREDAPDGVVFGEETRWAQEAEEAECACGEMAITERLEGRSYCQECCKPLPGISKWTGLPDFLPGDAILCRLNRPLIEAAFALLRARIACRVLGRDIGAGLVALVKKPKFEGSRPVGDWQTWAAAHLERERAKLLAKREFAKLGQLEDRIATVDVFIDDLRSTEEEFSLPPTISRLLSLIEEIFRDRGPEGMVTLGTIHKMKGLEFDRVFVLDASKLMPVPWGRGGGWELKQEYNMCYVAATRAARELRYITSDFLKGEE